MNLHWQDPILTRSVGSGCVESFNVEQQVTISVAAASNEQKKARHQLDVGPCSLTVSAKLRLEVDSKSCVHSVEAQVADAVNILTFHVRIGERAVINHVEPIDDFVACTE